MIIFRLVLYVFLFLCSFITFIFSVKTNIDRRRAPESSDNHNRKTNMFTLIVSFIGTVVSFVLSFTIKIPAPAFYPSDCEFSHPSPYMIRIEADSLFNIYYTLNGDSSPKKDGLLYEGPITLDKNTTVIAQSRFFFWWSETSKVNCPIYNPDEHDAVIEADGLDFEEKDVELLVGASYKINPVITPKDSISPILEWSSDNEKSVVVTSDGTVTGVEAGSAVVTAKVGILNLAAHCNVTVRENDSKETLPVISTDSIPSKTDGQESSSSPTSDHKDTGASKTTLTSLAIKTLPLKTAYYTGESLNTEGLVLTAKYSNGTVKSIQSGYQCRPILFSTPGNQTVNVTYADKTAAFTVSVNEITLESISIKSPPAKSSYYTGETLDTSGLELNALFSNGISERITSGFTCSPQYLSAPGQQTITVNYGEKSTSFLVSVKEAAADIVTLESIRIKNLPSKTVYDIGDYLDTQGLTLTACYSDSTTKDISSNFTCSPLYLNTSGKQTITVSYEGKTTSYNVTVREIIPEAVLINRISIKSQPYKTSYFVGDTLDTSGLELTAHLSNGTTKSITNGFSCSPKSLNTSGSQTISVTYEGNNAYFSVSVKDITVSTLSVRSLPAQTEYQAGDNLNTSGLELAVGWSNGKSENIRSGFSCSPTSLNTPGQQTITVSFGGKTTTFSVKVVSKPIKITSTELSTSYSSGDFLQSMFSVNFCTNVNYRKATFSIGGLSVDCEMTDTTEAVQAFDRNYFTGTSYDISLTVYDNYGNSDSTTVRADLGEIEVSMDQQKMELSADNSGTITAYVKGIAGHSVKWSCSNPDVLSISSDNVLGKNYASATAAAHKAGTAVVTATAGGKSAECVVTVK